MYEIVKGLPMLEQHKKRKGKLQKFILSLEVGDAFYAEYEVYKTQKNKSSKVLADLRSTSNRLKNGYRFTEQIQPCGTKTLIMRIA